MFRSRKHKPSAWYGNSLFIAGTTALSTRLCICQVLSSEPNSRSGLFPDFFQAVHGQRPFGEVVGAIRGLFQGGGGFRLLRIFQIDLAEMILKLSIFRLLGDRKFSLAHGEGQIIAEDTGLGFERTDGIVIIQIFQQGRSNEQKVAVYAELAKRLEAECGVRPEDLIISVMSNRHSDWSFGLGQAQFVDGTLHSPI